MFNTVKNIVYRGHLKTCNYKCSYCVLSKKSVLNKCEDENSLNNFINILPKFKNNISILIAPYGEALIHDYYMEKIAVISSLSNVKSIGIQTNGSFSVEKFLKIIDEFSGVKDKIKLWISYHPKEVEHNEFLSVCNEILNEGIEYSVGAVADFKSINYLKELRNKLSKNVYMWLNANEMHRYKYKDSEIEEFKEIDPNFQLELNEMCFNLDLCNGGRENIFVNGSGDIYCCIISKVKIGNIFEGEILSPKCRSKTCNCFLAYMNRNDIFELNVFGDKLIHRIR